VPKRKVVIVNAVNVILKRLGKLVDSAEVRELREKALACLHEAEAWKHIPPTIEQRDGLMKTVLDLHVRARKLGGSLRPPPR
jgi:hypothetical protein